MKTHVRAHSRNQQLNDPSAKRDAIKGRQVTKTYRVYKFDELSPEMQKKVLENYQDINTNFEWWDSEYWLDNQLPTKYQDKTGSTLFKWKNMYFDIERGSYVDFEGLEAKDKNKFLASLGIPKNKIDKIDYHFSHPKERSTRLELYGDDGDEITPHWSGDETNAPKWALEAQNKFSNMMNGVLKDLRTENQYRYSNEAIKETITANDYEFNENGKIEPA
jgi:hypothetical protein